MTRAGQRPHRPALGDVFTFQEARAAGLSQRDIYARRDSGEFLALGDGLYRRSDAPEADLDLIEIAERVPMATLCLETALARHGLTDVIPATIDIAVPRGANRPVLRAPHRLHTFEVDTFTIGREDLDVGARRPLGIYSAERCLIDAIRMRGLQGTDLAWEALRRWLATSERNPGRLIRLAQKFHGAEAPLRQAFEVLL